MPEGNDGGNYVIVAEIGLTGNRYGADIRTTEPMALDDARALMAHILRGEERRFCPVAEGAQLLTVGDGDQYLVVESHRLRPDSLSRLTIARQAGPEAPSGLGG